MQVIPAIDLKDGQCVRLKQGRAEFAKVYSADPVRMALYWEDQGAEQLHVVDLDGAFRGTPVHTGLIAAVASAVDIPVQAGGGLRTDADIRGTLACGVRRVIIGTRACRDPAGLRALVESFGPQIAVGIDARDDRVQVEGWVESTTTDPGELAQMVARQGVSTIVYTDTSVDGMLEGVNAAGIRRICEAADCEVIAAGGITTVADVVALRELGLRNLSGVVVGKALYERTAELPGLQRAAAGR